MFAKKDNYTNTSMNRTMDIILFDKNIRKSRVYILGLKYSAKRNIYYPATFFETKEDKYNNFRKTSINKITWV